MSAYTKPESGTPVEVARNIEARLRQVLAMDPVTYVESTRPKVELKEVPWTRPPNAQIARWNAIAIIAHGLVDALSEVEIVSPERNKR
jgi:hypothetical protein